MSQKHAPKGYTDSGSRHNTDKWARKVRPDTTRSGNVRGPSTPGVKPGTRKKDNFADLKAAVDRGVEYFKSNRPSALSRGL